MREVNMFTWSITSQHFKIRYRGYERGAWSGGYASPPNILNLVIEVKRGPWSEFEHGACSNFNPKA